MKCDVQRAGFRKAREVRNVGGGASGLKALPLALSFLLLAWMPLIARRSDASRVQTPAPSASVETAKWERFTYPGEEFSVELPEMPLVLLNVGSLGFVRDPGKKSGGGLSLALFEGRRVFGVYSSGVVFFITSFSNPRPKESLDYFASKRWGGAGIRVAAEGDLTLGGFEGREYRLTDDRLHGRARVLRTKKHAYLIQTLSFVENHPLVGRFLNSFELSSRPQGRTIVRAGMPAYTFETPTTPAGAEANAQAGARAFRLSDVARKALIIYTTEPGFTEEARKKNITGVVRLRAVLGASGKVENISVVRGLPEGLTEKAVYAARHVLFFPALKDGKEVSQFVFFEYNMNYH